MNEKMISVFNDLAFYEESIGRHFPAKAYRTAVKTFQGLDFEIKSAEQIKDLPGIGDGIFKKVQAFLEKGTFSKYEEYLNSDAAKMKGIAEVKGIGVNKAKELFNAGIHSVEDLRNMSKNLQINDYIPGTNIKLTNSIKIGLEFLAHTEKTRMPIFEHNRIAGDILNKIKEWKGVCGVSYAGSARRWNGKDQNYTVGDIDIIVSYDEDKDDFYRFLESLLDEVIMSGKTKISGIKENRQVDIRIVKAEQFESLLLHCTGPMSFNIQCRKIAMSHDWILNEYGLFDKNTNEKLASTERSIMEKLGMKYLEPCER